MVCLKSTTVSQIAWTSGTRIDAGSPDGGGGVSSCAEWMDASSSEQGKKRRMPFASSELGMAFPYALGVTTKVSVFLS